NLYKVELCTDDVSLALTKLNDCDQIEFCADLENDGLTPAIEDVNKLLEQSNTLIKVMIRCRPGNFEYQQAEFETMLSQAKAFLEIGVQNFVFGALSNQRIDFNIVKAFCEFVFPHKVCLHKAIDLSENIIEDVVLAKEIPNLNEILTSGGATTAIEGAEVIKNMISVAGDDIDIIAAGKITSINLHEIHELIGASVYHGKRIVK
ncbi:MAG TPA: copper homeostasis protein CutC, partial [Saprospiraceae bacterium]|nr:copper homeostasis protein CutC [Saprospiraceae bacterium]